MPAPKLVAPKNEALPARSLTTEAETGKRTAIVIPLAEARARRIEEEMKPPKMVVALTLLLGVGGVAVAGDGSIQPVDTNAAAKLIIGNTIVIDKHPKSRYDVFLQYYSSLDRVYECSKTECYTHSVRIVDGRICDPDLSRLCSEISQRWSFAGRSRETARKGARIGTLTVTMTYGVIETHAILRGNTTGFPDFTVPQGPLIPVTVDAKVAVPGTRDHHGQFAGRDLGKLFRGNTLVDTDGTLDSCLKGAAYYAPHGQLISLGCHEKDNGRPGVDFGIYLLHWRMKHGKMCDTTRIEPLRYSCEGDSGSTGAVLSDTGAYPPPAGRLAIQLPSSSDLPLLRGNIFQFKD